MADIVQDVPLKAPRSRVYQAVSTAAGLDCWWTKRASGRPVEGSTYELEFGPQYNWRATVIRAVPDSEFALRMLVADDDWRGSEVAFRLEETGGTTWMRFAHTGWPSPNEHYRISCHCWALYLRVLRRYLEQGELVAYEDRLDV